MNKLVGLAITSLLATSLNAQVSFNVKGKVPANYPATSAVMSYPEAGKYKADTANVNEGTFEFKGAVSRPELAELNLIIPGPKGSRANNQSSGNDESNLMKNVALFYLDGQLAVTFDTAGTSTTTGGGTTQEIWNEYYVTTVEKSKTDKGGDFFERNFSTFIKRHPDSYVSVDLLEVFAGNMQPKTFEPLYNALSTRMQNVAKVKDWKKQLDEAKKFESGKLPAIDFTLNDTQGKPVTLTSYKGGYVLLDFWASWCVPCRAENPNVLAAYNKFKNKNFQILAVSLDEKKDAWLNAIQEDKLPWTQVSDLKGFECEVGKIYNVTSIPQNFLIDPNGKIVGRNLRGKSLDEKLSELLK